MKIEFLIESMNGHDTVEVDEKDIEKEVKNHLLNGKWVTVEKKDGSSEILTKPIIEKKEAEKEDLGAFAQPKTQDKVKGDTKGKDWKSTFTGVKKAVVTNKMKGG